MGLVSTRLPNQLKGKKGEQLSSLVMSTYTEDDFETLLVGENLLHNLTRLIVLLDPEHEDVEDASNYFLILTRIQSLLHRGLLAHQIDPKVTICGLETQALLLPERLLLVVVAAAKDDRH